eukprot:CAMPEP_0198291788 /NCGR_PEP_ID=MMETSP1449-20131203/9195_1 /TAXON_ID=420275 /ORGANISM="Attheya septentrionalis, Strain CCMP2084" /LENGTH=346 /DNA_ID=CAMNT_0043990471 /DNA_START=196 /DNA_END=1236 /DNA_ORIENTATION=-
MGSCLSGEDRNGNRHVLITARTPPASSSGPTIVGTLLTVIKAHEHRVNHRSGSCDGSLSKSSPSASPAASSLQYKELLVAVTALSEKVLSVPQQQDLLKLLQKHASKNTILEDMTGTEDENKETSHAVIECPICWLPYDTKERVPCTLPCGHAVCLAHVDLLKNKCPICRAPSPSKQELSKSIALAEACVLLEEHRQETESLITMLLQIMIHSQEQLQTNTPVTNRNTTTKCSKKEDGTETPHKPNSNRRTDWLTLGTQFGSTSTLDSAATHEEPYQHDNDPSTHEKLKTADICCCINPKCEILTKGMSSCTACGACQHPRGHDEKDRLTSVLLGVSNVTTTVVAA